MRFTKMHGCGNDYVYINCFEQAVTDPAALAVRLSDRHKGVGGDGVILLCPPEDPANDARMRMFNLDGSEGRMCGNGIRCVARLAHDSVAVPGDKTALRIETLSGVKTCLLRLGTGGEIAAVTVDMGPPILEPARIPVRLPGETVIGREAVLAGETRRVTCVSMGNPHCVLFGDDPDGLELERIGPEFEHDPIFPEQVNTEFVQVIDGHTLNMRVWERGSGETLACGTGACAAAVAAVLCGYCPRNQDITVRLRGGELVIRWTEDTVWMTGEAVTVFTGEMTE